MGNKNTRSRSHHIHTSKKHIMRRRCSWFLVPVGVGKENRVHMKFSSQEIHQVRDAFAYHDRNSDGTIPTKSFIFVMRSLGHNLTEEETYDLIREVDYNNTGLIHLLPVSVLISNLGGRERNAV